MLCCSLPTCGVQHSSTRTCPEVWKSFGHSFCNEQMVGGMVGNDRAHMLQDWVLNIYPQYDTRTLWLDALLLIFLTIKFTYFTQEVTIKNKSTVFLFLVDPVVKSCHHVVKTWIRGICTSNRVAFVTDSPAQCQCSSLNQPVLVS